MSEDNVFNQSVVEVDESGPAVVNAQDTDEVSEPPRSRKGFILGISLIAIAVIAAVAIALLFFANRGSDADLPAGFPSQSELPLAEGELVETTELAGAQAAVTVEVESHEAQLAAVDQLLENGFSVIGQSGSGPVGTVTSLKSDSVAVRVEFSQTADGAFTVNYIAASLAEGESSQ